VLRLAVQGLRELSLRGFNEALQRSEEIYCTKLLKTHDVEEGVKAFFEKRPPNWAHR
jgi:enoyl-CoA hydratase/carnithine racemase